MSTRGNQYRTQTYAWRVQQRKWKYLQEFDRLQPAQKRQQLSLVLRLLSRLLRCSQTDTRSRAVRRRTRK